MLQSLHRVWAGSQSSITVKDAIWPGIRLLPILVHMCVLYFALVIVLSYMWFFPLYPLCILHHHPSFFPSLSYLIFSAVLITIMLHITPVYLPSATTIYSRSCQGKALSVPPCWLLWSSSHIPVKQYLLYLFKTYLHMAQHQSQVINQFLLLCISLHSASTF